MWLWLDESRLEMVFDEVVRADMLVNKKVQENDIQYMNKGLDLC